jgi:hypothetical protein
MEIRISEKEITAGVVAYLNSRGFNLDPATVKIDYTVGRKPAGVTAVLIEGDDVAEAAPAPVAKPVEKLTGQAITAGAQVAAEAAPQAVPQEDPAPELEPEVEAEPELAPEVPAEAEQGTSLFK